MLPSGCDVHSFSQYRVLLPEGVRIRECATCSLGESGWSWTGYPCALRVIWERGPYTLHTQTVPLAQHSSVHPGKNSVRRHFISGIPCTDILHQDISQPDGRGGRFNFSNQTYPGSSDSAYQESFSLSIQCRGVLLKLPDISDWHLGIFCFKYFLSKSQSLLVTHLS